MRASQEITGRAASNRMCRFGPSAYTNRCSDDQDAQNSLPESRSDCLESDLLSRCRAGDGPAAPVEWVETGKAVSAQYAEARAEARQKALLRNACFQQVHRRRSCVGFGPSWPYYDQGV